MKLDIKWVSFSASDAEITLTAETPEEKELIKRLWLGFENLAMEVKPTGSNVTFKPIDIHKK
jgi:hypothetical protein